MDDGTWPFTRKSAASRPRIGSLKNRRTRFSPRTVLPGGGRTVANVGGMSSTIRYRCVAAAVSASIGLGGRAVSAMPWAGFHDSVASPKSPGAKVNVHVDLRPLSSTAGSPLSQRSSASTPVTSSLNRTVTSRSRLTLPGGGSIDTTVGGDLSGRKLRNSASIMKSLLVRLMLNPMTAIRFLPSTRYRAGLASANVSKLPDS